MKQNSRTCRAQCRWLCLATRWCTLSAIGMVCWQAQTILVSVVAVQTGLDHVLHPCADNTPRDIPAHLSSTNSPTLQGDGEVKKREDVRRKVTAANETLFVVNFDPDQCRERDLERHFGEYGRLRRVQVRLCLSLCTCWGGHVCFWGVRAPVQCGGCIATWESHSSVDACAVCRCSFSCGGLVYALRLRCVQVWQPALVAKGAILPLGPRQSCVPWSLPV